MGHPTDMSVAGFVVRANVATTSSTTPTTTDSDAAATKGAGNGAASAVYQSVFEPVAGVRPFVAPRNVPGTQGALAAPSHAGFQLAVTKNEGSLSQADHGPYRIAAQVGPGAANDPRDVAWVAHRLELHIDNNGRPYLEQGGNVFEALRRFQRQRTKYRDGKVDPGGSTEFALAASPAHDLRGSVGTGGRNRPADVAKIQSAMVQERLLPAGSFTYGELDPNNRHDPTIRAIRAYQRAVGKVDGRVDVGGTTHDNLRIPHRVEPRGLAIEAAVGGSTGNQSADVALVQERLVAHGVLQAGAFVAGTLNDATRNAIRQFQSRFTRRPDGVVSPGKESSRYLFLTPDALNRAIGPAPRNPAPAPQPEPQPAPRPAPQPAPRPAPRTDTPTTSGVYRAVSGDTPLKIIARNYQNADGSALNFADQQRILLVVAEKNQATLPDFEDGRVGVNDDVALSTPAEIAAATGLSVVRVSLPLPSTTPSGRLGTVRAVTGDMTITNPPRASIRRHLDDAAAATGIPRRWMYNMASVESGYRPGSVNGRYRGLYQMTQADVTRYLRKAPVPGLQSESATDARAAAFAFARMTAERIQRYSRRWGRPVEEFEIYMMHQQGASGYHHHATNPRGAAWANFRRATGNKWSATRAKRAIWGNMSGRMRRQFPGGVETVTSGDFIRAWREGYDRKRRGLGA